MAEPRAVDGGREEFTALALEHFSALYNAALALTRQHADAQDLVQDTYLKAYRFWQHFAPGTHIKAWLLTILRHALINTYRKTLPYHTQNGSERLVSAYTALPVPRVCTDRAVLEEMLRHVVQDEVKQALYELPETFRLVVLLADLEDCSYKDIATIIGCPVGTVMSRLCRGRKQLRRRLQAFAQESGYLSASQPQTAVLLA